MANPVGRVLCVGRGANIRRGAGAMVALHVNSTTRGVRRNGAVEIFPLARHLDVGLMRIELECSNDIFWVGCPAPGMVGKMIA